MSVGLPHLALLFNAFIWGVSWVPYKWLEAQGLSILWATAICYVAASIALSLARPQALSALIAHKSLWIMGLFYGLTNTCFNWALTLGDVVRVVLLFYLMPLWSALFARLLLAERLTVEGWARIGLALAGAVVVLGAASETSASALWSSSFFADTLSVAGGLFFGLANVLLRSQQGSNSAERTLAMFIGSGSVPFLMMLAASAAGLYAAGNPLQAAFEALWVLPLLALGLACANYSLQFGGSRLPAQTTSLIMLSEIVFAAVSAWIIVGKQMTASEWVGGAMIICAAIWASLRPSSGARGSPPRT